MADLKISQLNSLPGSSLAATDELAVVDTSASETKKITAKEAVQYGYGLITAGTLDGDIIEPGTTSARGTVQLTDSTSSTSTTTAATPNAVKAAYDLANAAMPKAGGTMTGQILGDNSTSASTPGYAFDGDSNTGLYTTGADELALTTGGSARLTIDSTGTVVIPGNFTVQGTTTTIDTTTLVVKDKNIEMGAVTTPTDVTADGGGITLKGTTDKTINWVDATDAWTSSERFSIPLGSAAAPSLTINGDANSGLYSPGADQLALATNGTGRLFVNANGQIGIGTNTSLLYPLNIQSGSGADAIMLRGRLADDKSTILFVNNGAATNLGWIQVDATGFAIATGSAPTERLRIDATGQIEAASLGTAAAPTFSWTGDPNTGIYSPGADQVAISTGGSGRLFVDSNGGVGVNTNTSSINSIGKLVVQNASTTAEERLIVAANAYLSGPTFTGTYIQQGDTATTGTSFGLNRTNLGSLIFQNTSAGLIGCNSGVPLVFGTSGQEHVRIDSSGRLLVGTSSARSNYLGGGTAPRLQLEATNFPGSALALTRNETSGAGAGLLLGRTRGASNGSNTAVIQDDGLGIVSFQGADGTNFIEGARISASVDGTPGANDMPGRLVFSTTADGASSPTERLRITSAGLVGIGTTSPDSPLHIRSADVTEAWAANASDTLKIEGSVHGINLTTSTTGFIAFSDAAARAQGLIEYLHSSDSMQFRTAGSERARIDSSGRLLVGTSTYSGGSGAGFEIEGTGSFGPQIRATAKGSDIYPVYQVFRKSRGASIVQNNDFIFEIKAEGFDGSTFVPAAAIRADVDGTPGANDMPGRLVFSTTADGASTPTERMRIDNAGSLIYGTSTSPGADITSGTGFYYQISTGFLYVRSNGSPVAAFNRGGNDGTLVEFKQDQTTEGTISVSGTTVSYNGAHLSRWSQLPSGAERTEILRGSVLSNIDEMCEWGNEDNEQLNRMKVSDIEGDKNVSGVFQAWDDDDDTYTNDFYCAMTGDFIIRIGAGTTVERGDLLMSAGDGTAKPQDDDIIRSKTIAKVTSTNVSCTYEDGSYCVPCVLMAC